MANHRKYGRKKGKKATGHRSVSAKRRAAGRKAWLTKVHKYGRAQAIAMIGRKKRHRRGSKRTYVTKRRRRRSYTHRAYGRKPFNVMGATAYNDILTQVQTANKTLGMSPTTAERMQAKQLYHRSARAAGGRIGGAMSAEETFKKRIAEHLADAKAKAAKTIVDLEEAEAKRVAYLQKIRAKASSL